MCVVRVAVVGPDVASVIVAVIGANCAPRLTCGAGEGHVIVGGVTSRFTVTVDDAVATAEVALHVNDTPARPIACVRFTARNLLAA